MICHACKKVDASAFLVDVVEGKPTRRLFCEQCAAEYFDISDGVESPWTHVPTFEEKIEILPPYGRRFTADAYRFARDGIDYSTTTRNAANDPSGHSDVSSRELLDDLATL